MSIKNNISGALKVFDAFTLWANYEEKVKKAADSLRGRIPENTDFGIVLGSGLSGLIGEIENSEKIPYAKIPNFPKTTVTGHSGNLHIGSIGGAGVIGFEGRIHYYEGADLPFNAGVLRAVFSVHVLAELGIKNYFFTNAAGGLNPDFKVGDIMIVKSHINLPIPSPLLGKVRNFERIDGSPLYEFQPMNEVYDTGLINILSDSGISYEGVHEGVYMALTGRQYELSAESSMLRKLGADAVGMSSTIEVLAAASRGLRAVGFSTITNVISADGTNATNHEEVTAILKSDQVKNRLSGIVKGFFERYISSGQYR